MYYAPRRRTGQTLEIIDMIDSTQGIFSVNEADSFFRRKFYALLGTVSSGWSGTCSDFKWQSHYGQKVRHVGIREMIGNIITTYHTTKRHLMSKKTLTSSRQRIMYCSLAKIFVYLPVKEAAKTILKPLGLWDVLKSIKLRITGRSHQN